MYSLIAHYDTFSIEEKVAFVVPVTSIEAQVTCSKAMFVLSVYFLINVYDRKIGPALSIFF